MGKIRVGESLLSPDAEYTENAVMVAEEFNRFFAGTVADSGLQNANVESPFLLQNSFGFFDITGSEVKCSIDKLPNSNSHGHDSISAKMLKSVSGMISESLAVLFNKSIRFGLFPTAFKDAEVVPVPKAGDLSDVSNYRPISLLPTLGKLFELLVKKRILNFLTKFGFFSARQYGFLPGRSTEQALAKHTMEITAAIEKNLKVAAVYLDIRKAFDSVNHKILLKKLRACGIRGFMLDWFASYLQGRRQRVKICGKLSSWSEIGSGVPQGSVLGPILFLIYVNDLLKLKFFSSIYSFADDTSLVCCADSGKELKYLENDLRVLYNWLRRHNLNLNISKSKIVYFAYKIVYDWRIPVKIHTCDNQNINCMCLSLEITQNYKYLGLIINDTLSWSEHCLLLRGRMRSLNYLLFYLSKFVSGQHLRRFYRAVIEPVLRYGLPIWGGCADYHLQPVRVLQHRSVRMVAGLPPIASASAALERVKVPSVETLTRIETCKLAGILRDEIGLRAPSRNLRSCAVGLLQIPNWLRAHSQAQFGYRAPVMYNELPEEIRVLTGAKQGRALRRYLLPARDAV